MSAVTGPLRFARMRAAAVMLPAVVMAVALALPSAASAARPRINLAVTAPSHANALGELDCNGYSTVQRAQRPTMNCTDIRGLAGVDNQNTWGGRFYDNGN